MRIPLTLTAARDAMLVRHTPVSGLAWAALAVLVPTAIRYATDRGANGVPFVTYFPAIVVAGLFLGWKLAALVAIGSAVTARLLFMQDAPQLGRSVEGLVLLGLFVLSCAALIGIAEALRRTLEQLTAASERENLLNAELRHRLKNLLAVVGSLATLSHRHSTPELASEALNERIMALSRAIDLLGTDGPRACALPDLAEEALRPFRPLYDIRFDGPDCAVQRDSCVPAVLALHELTTNAIKYGALSVPGGVVALTWTDPGDGLVHIQWQESGGPPVARPTRKGMGSRILSMQSETARFKLELPAEGAMCRICLKAAGT